jgi:hypothetical protein
LVSHTQTRERAEKVYLTAAHERALMGSQSPAPNTYGARSSFGGQNVSKNRNSASVTFGTRPPYKRTTFVFVSGKQGEYCGW